MTASIPMNATSRSASTAISPSALAAPQLSPTPSTNHAPSTLSIPPHPSNATTGTATVPTRPPTHPSTPPPAASSTSVSAPDGITGKLCTWIDSLSLSAIPPDIQTRAKYLILDGLACGLVGAHLPWSEKAAQAVFGMEGSGDCGVFGWEKGLGPLPAALLNSTFIQAFELDDYHSEAPLHSNAILLPALFAAAEHEARMSSASSKPISGQDFLLATIVGYEVGPRVGLGLYGGHMLSMGWHSGAVFGPCAAAAAVSKVLGCTPNVMEDALGIACTQACGLMSAQFESMVKRMQHGFAARNGLFAVLLARSGYLGIKQVLERPYGGFLTTFGQGSGKDPVCRPEEVTKGLGEAWEVQKIKVKPYASMAGTHCTVDCIAALQTSAAERMKDLDSITGILIEMSEPAFKHGGWTAQRPLTVTGAQMSCSYIAAVQLVDGMVTPAQFRHRQLDRDELWRLIKKTECRRVDDLDNPWAQRVTLEFGDGQPALVQIVSAPKGVKPALSNEEIRQKWRLITQGVISDERREKIENVVLNIEDVADIVTLGPFMAEMTANAVE